jgi:hypothetical protein
MQDVYRRTDLEAAPKTRFPVLAIGALALSCSLPVSIWVASHTWIDEAWPVLVFGAAGSFLGVVLAARVLVGRPRVTGSAWLAAVTATLVGSMTGHLGLFLAYVSTISFTRGRQLRRFGQPLLPDVGAEGSAWTHDPKSDDAELPAIVPTAIAPELAEQWRENGKTEHASVAAFARLSSDLMALGAPPNLLEAANQDALDEIRHTRMCFALARELDGKNEGPLAFPAARTARTLPANRTIALTMLAVDSLVDGALHEGVSAAVLAELARRTRIPRIEAMLRQIARDEGRHAAHGWDVAMWCLEEAGEPVLRAIEGALRGLPHTMQSPLPERAKDGAWEAYGVHGHALEAQCFGRVRDRLVRRVTQVRARSTRTRKAAYTTSSSTASQP